MKEIEIPFGAKDSELKGWEYTIPEGMEAEIKDGKIVVREKDSEDERIRKLLVWQVHRNIEDDTNDLAQSVYDGIKGHDPDLEESIEDWKRCLAYLEKQKEQKEIPLMNGNADLYFDNWIQHNDTTKRGYFEEGIRYAQRLQKEQPTDIKSHRVIKAARRVLENWLYGDVNADVSGDLTELEYAFKDYDGEEKQKENAKSCDSIPADCTSVAKCEDRWHKVADSLPDNPREVLCKDEAGNYFIGRYYTSEGWEISNYDDEDKPHHLNPPVSKWIDFPSEKQKEQKPAEWSEEDELIRKAILKYLDPDAGTKITFNSELVKWSDWLKSLRPQPHWKPSEEQMEALRRAVNKLAQTDVADSVRLSIMYDNLKKLI